MFGFKKDYQINYGLSPLSGARKAQTLTAEVAPTLLRFCFEPAVLLSGTSGFFNHAA